jgi:hypothetical protein
MKMAAVRGSWSSVVLLVPLCLASCLSGCKKSDDSTDVGRQSRLGISPGTWPEEGPSPIAGAVQGSMTPEAFLKDDVTGAVHRVIVHPATPTTVYAGTVNGGVWKTTGANSIFATPPARVNWEPNTDALPSLTIGALVMDPLDPQRLVAGTGGRSSGLPAGVQGLIYVTNNGGNTWGVFDNPLMRNRTIFGLATRGALILAVGTRPEDGKRGFLARSENGGADWTDLGGTGGFPVSVGSGYDIVRDPSNADRIYVVVADRGFGGSGVYLGTNNGTTWTNVSDNDSSPNGLAAVLRLGDVHNARLAVSPTGRLAVTVAAVGQVVYVGQTTNQGQSWTALDVPAYPSDVGSVPQTANPIAQITRGGVPGGQPTTILVDAGIAHNLANHPGSRVRLLGLPVVAGVNDLNGDWIAAPYNDPAASTNPSTTKFILKSRLTAGDGDGTTAAVDVSGQGTWQLWQGVNPGGQAGVHLALAVDPLDPKFVYIGGDAGSAHLGRGDVTQAASTAIPSAQWSKLDGAGGAADGRGIHADIRDLVFDPTGQLLYCAQDGGVFVRTSPRDNATGEWYTMSGDLSSVELRSIALDPLSHGIVGGSQDNGTPSQLAGSNGAPQAWRQIEFADGVAVAAVDAHTTDPVSGRPVSYRYSSWQLSNDLELHRFDDTGAWLETIFLLHPNPALSKLVVGTVNGVVQHLYDVENIDWLAAFGVNRVYDPLANPQPNPQNWLLIAGHNQGVWESRDRGETTALVPGSPVNARSFSYGNPTNVEALWVAAENNGSTMIYSRLAAGETLAVEATFLTSGQAATAVAMSAGDPTIAYATADARVFQLTHSDPPLPPVDVTGDLSRFRNGNITGVGLLRSIVYVPSAANGDRIFVGAAEGGLPGVFMMNIDNPGVWTRVGTNLPNANAMALDYDARNEMLVVGTGGRGAWSLTGAGSLGRAPKALCKDLTRPAGATTCRATVSPAEFNNGSVDPEGNPLTFTAVNPTTLDPISLAPFPPGSFPLTIQVSDTQGASALCQPNLTVVDVTSPVLQVPPAVTLTTCADALSVTVGQATATDNCLSPLVPTGQVVSVNGVALPSPIPVVNGRATLSPGTYTIRWTVSDGSNPPVQANQTVTVKAAIQTSQSFVLEDRARVSNFTGGFAGVLNSGTGITRIGQDGRTAGVVSRGPVSVLHRAIVAGNAVSASTVSKDSDATITGTTTQNAFVQLPALPTLPPFPPPTMGGFTVNSNTTQTRPPGSYSGATILNGGTLNLQAGDYYFQSLTINSGSTVRVPTTARIFVRDTLVHNAPFRVPSGTAIQTVPLGFAGSSVSLFALFNGTLIAPNAAVTFGTSGAKTFTGSFFARSFQLTPDTNLICRP